MVNSIPSAPLIQDDPKSNVSMAAGFEHFSTGYMRNWGRDTFIAYSGLLLTTGRYSEARHILLDYLKSVRHGSIPNLMDRGVKSRYNARDATWFYLQSFQDYIKMTKDFGILEEKVERLYSSDNVEDGIKRRTDIVKNIIQVRKNN